MTKQPALSRETTDVIMHRIRQGESVYALAAEHSRYPSNLYKLLERRYGFEARERPSYWPGRLSIPDDPATRAYIAAILDGEGSLKRRKDGLWTIVVVMTNEPVIRWLYAFGGNFGTWDRPEPRKRIYRWQVARRYDVLTLLTAVSPYMIVRRDKADAAIAELGPRIARAFQRNVAA